MGIAVPQTNFVLQSQLLTRVLDGFFVVFWCLGGNKMPRQVFGGWTKVSIKGASGAGAQEMIKEYELF